MRKNGKLQRNSICQALYVCYASFHTVLKPHTFILPNPFFVCCSPILCPGRLTLKADSFKFSQWEVLTNSGGLRRREFRSSFLTACLSRCCGSARAPSVTTSPVRWHLQGSPSPGSEVTISFLVPSVLRARVASFHCQSGTS